MWNVALAGKSAVDCAKYKKNTFSWANKTPQSGWMTVNTISKDVSMDVFLCAEVFDHASNSKRVLSSFQIHCSSSSQSQLFAALNSNYVFLALLCSYQMTFMSTYNVLFETLEIDHIFMQQGDVKVLSIL